MAKWKNSSTEQIDACQKRHHHYHCHQCLFVNLLASGYSGFCQRVVSPTPFVVINPGKMAMVFFFLKGVSYRKNGYIVRL